ncbi:hypothetical protein K493DRAFT_317109 [Basidiobolus meristosporus CBS 931.73]|uniref:Zinc finger C2H2 LYAR-type domain-containing protein n=1 Tax=Basidiobolus meristosporus CBS 931.73 TaxID=1314790 RepID=A0A1Y1Y139_9FUNG|nr:hypothetical protein K493DRAFT_317109 [Basidiobolus meristosporus CBS 931.73]|eukprot:ORX91688.1 hypothetical protein K493DRAFT_317109 [Basidiobolus meristosporus CBS 931.73]
MVSFVCDTCQETLKKNKLDSHFGRCPYASYSCIDCYVSFQGTDYRQHTSCISEAEKYEKGLFKGKKGANKQQTPKQNNTPKPAAQPATIVADLKKVTEEKKETPVETPKKRKEEEKVKDTPSKKSKKSDNQWDEKKLDPDYSKTVKLAIRSVLEKENDLSLKTLRKKVVKKFSKHPECKLEKSEIEKKFEEFFVMSLKDETVLLK